MGQVYSRIWERGRDLRDVRIELHCINLIELSTFVDKKFFKKPATSATPATSWVNHIPFRQDRDELDKAGQASGEYVAE